MSTEKPKTPSVSEKQALVREDPFTERKAREAALNKECTKQRGEKERRRTDTPHGPRGPRGPYIQ